MGGNQSKGKNKIDIEGDKLEPGAYLIKGKGNLFDIKHMLLHHKNKWSLSIMTENHWSFVWWDQMKGKSPSGLDIYFVDADANLIIVIREFQFDEENIRSLIIAILKKVKNSEVRYNKAE